MWESNLILSLDIMLRSPPSSRSHVGPLQRILLIPNYLPLLRIGVIGDYYF